MIEGGCHCGALRYRIEDVKVDEPGTAVIPARLAKAEVLVLGTPDYHGSVSGALKNFTDHFWKEYAGKLFGAFQQAIGAIENALLDLKARRMLLALPVHRYSPRPGREPTA